MEVAKGEGGVLVALDESDLRRPADCHAAFERLIYEDCVRRIAVDLSRVEMLSSLMIGTIVSLHLLAYENVVVLRFEGLHEKLRALLNLVGVDRLIEAHYGRPARPGECERPNA
jgi:anti-anti-sigma regulatory factor